MVESPSKRAATRKRMGLKRCRVETTYELVGAAYSRAGEACSHVLRLSWGGQIVERPVPNSVTGASLP